MACQRQPDYIVRVANVQVKPMGPPENPLETRRVYSGRVVNLSVDRVRFPDGSQGELEIIRHPGAAAVVPVSSPSHAPDPTILMLRQYRYAAGGVIWEVPAGVLEPDEAPEVCARRELLEEAGVEAGRVEPLTTIYTTPGFTDERIHLFAAFDLKKREHRHERDEFIQVQPVPLSQVLEKIRAGEITDGKSIVALLYLAAFRLSL